MMLDENKKLEILHDHYKESFAYIRERERQRDNQFLILIVLFGLLFLEIQYPNNIQGLLKTIKTPITEFNFGILPISILSSVTWSLLFLYVLRNSQLSITIERQYEYLHKLEDIIGEIIDSSIYNREGRAYLANYPLFSNVVWIFYILAFPILSILLILTLLLKEYYHEIVKYHYIYDGVMGGAIVIVFVLYRGPQLLEFVNVLMVFVL